GSMRDITELKEAEAKLRTLTDDAPVLLCMIDAEDRLVFANNRFLEFFGRTLDDMASGRWDWTADVHPDDLPETRRRWSEGRRRPRAPVARRTGARGGGRLTTPGGARSGAVRVGVWESGAALHAGGSFRGVRRRPRRHPRPKAPRPPGVGHGPPPGGARPPL